MKSQIAVLDHDGEVEAILKGNVVMFNKILNIKEPHKAWTGDFAL